MYSKNNSEKSSINLSTFKILQIPSIKLSGFKKKSFEFLKIHLKQKFDDKYLLCKKKNTETWVKCLYIVPNCHFSRTIPVGYIIFCPIR